MYDSAYLLAENAEPVSLTLPLQETPFTDTVLFPFFDGLIPEGCLLGFAVKNWKLNPRDRMGLLNADMHLKNFSLINQPGIGYALSPAYDLVSTALVNPADEEELALTLNGKKGKSPEKICNCVYKPTAKCQTAAKHF